VDHGVPARDVGPAIGFTEEQVERVFRDIEAKRRVSRYLHHVPTPMSQP
jgi:NAD+ synthase